MNQAGIDPSALIGLTGVPVTVALTELVKRVAPRVRARYLPLVALGFSFAINLGLAPSLAVDWPTAVTMGLVAGLAASGLYSASKEMRA